MFNFLRAKFIITLPVILTGTWGLRKSLKNVSKDG